MAYCSGNNTPIFKVSDTHLSLSQVFLYEQTLVCNISKPSIDVVETFWRNNENNAAPLATHLC